MLKVFGSQYRNCDGLSRRNFLELGAPLLGLGLADVLALRAAGANTKQPNEKLRGGK